MDTTQVVARGVEAIPGLKLLGSCEAMIVCFAGDFLPGMLCVPVLCCIECLVVFLLFFFVFFFFSISFYHVDSILDSSFYALLLHRRYLLQFYQPAPFFTPSFLQYGTMRGVRYLSYFKIIVMHLHPYFHADF